MLTWVTLGAMSLELLVPAAALKGKGARYSFSLDPADIGGLARLAVPLMVGAAACSAEFR